MMFSMAVQSANLAGHWKGDPLEQRKNADKEIFLKNA
jgi:hypothetical protein